MTRTIELLISEELRAPIQSTKDAASLLADFWSGSSTVDAVLRGKGIVIMENPRKIGILAAYKDHEGSERWQLRRS